MTRRNFLAAGLSSVAVPAAIAASDAGRDQTPRSAASTKAALFQDPALSYEAMRALGYASAGGADVMEVLQALDRVDPSNLDTWFTAWNRLASRVQAEGAQSLARGHKVSARQSLLRASMYYRSAAFFLTSTPADPRLNAAMASSAETFQAALPHLDHPAQTVQIPFEGKQLPGYYLRPKSRSRSPLVILHTGFDGTAEEIYFSAVAAVERGYACLIFDGPGQGQARRSLGLTFRPDWERVVTPVIDFAERLPGADLRGLTLAGFSFGGYLAPRAAAFDPRVKHCIADGGVFSEYEAVMGNMPPVMAELLDQDPAAFDQAFRGAAAANIGTKWALGNGLYTFGQPTPSAWCKALRAYTLDGGVAERISAHVLVVDSEKDAMMPGQAKRLFDRLTGPKTWLQFTEAEGAHLHCQVGAQVRSAQRIFDWLDEQLHR